MRDAGQFPRLSDHQIMILQAFAKDHGRLWAYVHWMGARMERGYANGYGYDKRSAAVAAAICKINPATTPEGKASADLNAFAGAALEMDGRDWTRAIEDAGFTVWQAV
jgi:hypothetical protein